MSVFFFDSQINGKSSIDDEGIDLPNLDAARIEAISAIYALAQDEAVDSHDAVRAVLRIRDDANHVALEIDMRVVVSYS